MPVIGKKVTWERADMALLAIMDLYECDDLPGYDPRIKRMLDEAADAVRQVRDRCPEPAVPRSLRLFGSWANVMDEF